MSISKIIGTHFLNKYRKLTEENLIKTQLFLRSSTNRESKVLIVTLELAQILNINAFDLYILSYNYCSSKKTWDKIFYARIMAVCLSDFFDKIFHITGKDLLTELESINATETINQVKGTMKNLSTIKKDIEGKLKNIRNITLAHKTLIGSDLFAEIEGIDHHEIYDCTSKVLSLINFLNTHILEILRNITK
jgi:hypothetical protein